MNKRQYRSFNIREVEGVDDFSAIAEAVGGATADPRDEERPMPDLVLIDGGVGQLNAAMAAVDSLGLDLPIAALAKREELVWLPAASEPLRLDTSDLPTSCCAKHATRPIDSPSAVTGRGGRNGPFQLNSCRTRHRTGPGSRVAQSFWFGSRGPTGIRR